MNSRDDEAGFTLIELLIVIVILGILAAIVVFAVGSARDDSVLASCKADRKTVATAAEAYKAKYGNYAATIDDLVSGSFLKQLPPTSEYTIDYASGTTTGAINGGASC